MQGGDHSGWTMSRHPAMGYDPALLYATTGIASYLSMLAPRLDMMGSLLTHTGQIYVHLDYRLSHYARVLLDERFGVDAYRNEIVWKRSNPKNDPKQYGRIHDTILYYAASEAEFYPVFGDYREEYVEQAYRHTDPDGRRYCTLPLHATHNFSETDDNTRRFGNKVLRPPRASSGAGAKPRSMMPWGVG
jgi:adenine specific DNA methylase Mod